MVVGEEAVGKEGKLGREYLHNSSHKITQKITWNQMALPTCQDDIYASA